MHLLTPNERFHNDLVAMIEELVEVGAKMLPALNTEPGTVTRDLLAAMAAMIAQATMHHPNRPSVLGYLQVAEPAAPAEPPADGQAADQPR